MEILYFFGAVLVLVVSILVAKEFADIAEEKGHDGNRYFWFTFLLGITGMLMVIALPNKKAINLRENIYNRQSARTAEQQTHSESCGRKEDVSTTPYRCGKCGHEGPYEGKCPACGSTIKLYNC